MVDNILALPNRIIDDEGNVVYFNDAIIELLYNNTIPSDILFDTENIDIDLFNKFSYENFNDVFLKLPTALKTHEERKQNWFFPIQYNNIDLYTYFNNLDADNKERIESELNLFLEKDLECFLRFCIYLSDIIKEKDIVVGIGRGSSVASYLLYLLKINLLNPLDYDLPITDFLK